MLLNIAEKIKYERTRIININEIFFIFFLTKNFGIFYLKLQSINLIIKNFNLKVNVANIFISIIASKEGFKIKSIDVKHKKR